ncbi:MAG: 2'-5' RNA ligase family protein [Nocardioidaceae bacterium]|nr:2'-5' RNA ligase family protein [Nocardioidaceae bacterium]
MALAVCLLFDPPSERLLRGLWSRLEAGGIRTLATHTHGHHHPHLSYAVLRAWDLDRVREALDGLPGHGSFPLSFHGMVAFPRGRAALAPALTADVVRRQQDVVAAVLGAGADLHLNYRPGHWVPHVSVATRARGVQLATVAKEIADSLPLDVRVDRAALVDSASGETWVLDGIP